MDKVIIICCYIVGIKLEVSVLLQAYPVLDQQLLSAATHSCSSPLFTHIADELSRLFLPSITPAPDTLKLTQKR